MEIEGHPTQDLIDELEVRGATPVRDTGSGPSAEAVRLLHERHGNAEGMWLYLPAKAFMTGLDDVPGL